MLQTRYRQIRAAVGVVVLSLALLAGVAGTTQPVEARTNIEAYCEAVGGRLSAHLSLRGYYITCITPDGGVLNCSWGPFLDPGTCFYWPPSR